MIRTPGVRRTALTGLCGALVATSALAAVPGGAVLQAVVSYDGKAPSAPGVELLGTYDTLQMAVVRGHADALYRLTRQPGVRAVTPDVPVQLAEHDHGRGAGVLATEGLRGGAGNKHAGRGVRVAVVDTGVSDTPALNRASGRLVDAADASVPGQVRTAVVGTDGFTDGYGHGTFMATIVAGGPVRGTDGEALGVAPGATVLAVRVATADGTTSLSRVLGGLDWVAAHPGEVDVASLALSRERPGAGYGPDPLTAAVERVRAAGITVVVASGNTAGTVSDPGFDPQALTVGAADITTRQVAAFSGSGEVQGVQKPDVVASGVSVLGLLPTGSVLELAPGTAHLRHGLYRGSGTSQATAVTAGLAAVLLGRHPHATPAQVKASLRCAATDLPGDRDGAGLVRTPNRLCAGPDGQALDGSGDATGELTLNANAWAANAWAANAWAANSWTANAWAANAWAANAWAAGDWTS